VDGEEATNADHDGDQDMLKNFDQGGKKVGDACRVGVGVLSFGGGQGVLIIIGGCGMIDAYYEYCILLIKSIVSVSVSVRVCA
jgi:hypothetical protein